MSFNNNNRDSYRRMDSNSSNHHRSGGGGHRRGGGGRNRVNTSQFPMEHGIICSLKESFGFIHCAQRPEEIFFHYSEVRNEHPDDLMVDTEVEFKIGASEKNESKLAAYEVVTLPQGTVVWETEDVVEQTYVGIVEKPARMENTNTNNNSRGGGGGRDNNNNNGPTEGTIRVVLKPEALDNDDNTDEEGVYGDLIRYRADEYKPDNNSGGGGRGGNSNRLFRGDLMEFRILIDRRTNQKYARYMTLQQSDRDRREAKMLKDALPEEGVIIALNKGYGFLKSNKRHEHVYFHFSNFTGPESQIRKGQEVKFLLVTEHQNNNNNNRNNNNSQPPKCSARKLECLPKGTVIFHKVVARGVKGVVTMIPQPPASGDRGYADDKDGTIRLLHPMDDGDHQDVKDVSLQFSDAPGGVYTYQHRGQSVNGLWIQQGDTLLFDVVKELADGSYRAAPTRHTIALGGDIVPPEQEEAEGDKAADKKEKDDEGIVRLVSLSLIGRSEGTIHTIKPQSGYGFIHFAERPIDVHFSTYNIIPEELQSDLRKHMGVVSNGPVALETGASVQFDICAHGTVASGGSRGRHGRGGGGGGGGHERENVKGHRIVLLPPNTVHMELMIATNVKGTIRSADNKQLYAGFVDLMEEEDANVQPMSDEKRHPLVVQMVEEFMEETTRPFGRESLVYHDVLSVKEDDVVVNILKSKASGILTYMHIPVAGLDAHPGRLCIRRAEPPPAEVVAATEEEEPKEPAEGGEEKGEGGEATPKPEAKPSKPNSKKKKDQKPSKNLRFDKASLSEEFKNDIPPSTGDIITCDVAQSRRTGKLLIHNLKIVERVKQEPGGEEATGTSGIGVVKDVVPNRNFGFISLFDENATKRELLFFQLSEGRGSKKLNVRKNDEVKFDISIDKSGKRIAKNVQIMAMGSIPSKESKNACKGYILMEPTHTSLADTPLRKTNSNMSSGSGNGGGGGRWGNVVKDDSHHKAQQKLDIHEEGCILLLEDKIGMFTGHPMNRKRSKSIDDDARSVDSIDDARSIDSSDDLRSIDSLDGTTDDEVLDIVLNSHLPYKNGAIAIHGSGAACTMDSKAAPRRGDLVSFVKSRKGKGIRDVRIVKRQAATLLRGRLENIVKASATGGPGKAKFFAATEREETYDVNLAEVVSCDASILKEKESVEGIVHEGKIYGICRTADLYLESKLGTSHKERPKLNLSVRKNRGGTIIAQSMMAKGPDGTNGFAAGWTTRQSQYQAAPPQST